MTDTSISDAVVFPQDQGTGIGSGNSDFNSAGYFGLIAENLSSSYVGGGLTFKNINTTNDTFDLGSGFAYVEVEGASVQSGSQSSHDTALPDPMIAMIILPTDETGLSLDTSTTNDVYLFFSESSQDSVTVRVGSGVSNPTEPSIHLGTIDSSDGSTTRASDAVSINYEVDLSSNKITNLAAPTADNDAARKAYVDAVEQGLDIKDSVVAATDGSNVDLSSSSDPNPIDGVTLSDGERVLLKDQTTGSENGIYDASTATDPTTWSRSNDFDGDSDVTSGAFVFIEEGTNNSNRGFVLTTNDPITVGTDSLSFTQFSGAGQITAGDGIKKSGDTLNIEPADFAGNALEDDGSDNLAVSSGAIQADELDLSITPTWTGQHRFDSGIDVRSDIVDNATVIWDSSGGHIDQTALENDSVTVTAGDGLKNGGSVALGGTTTIDIEPADFAGSGLQDDGADDLELVNDSITITAGDGLKNGGSVALGNSTTIDIEPADFAGAFLSDDGTDDLQVNLGAGVEGDGSDNVRLDEDFSATWTSSHTFNQGLTSSSDISLSGNLSFGIAAPEIQTNGGGGNSVTIRDTANTQDIFVASEAATPTVALPNVGTGSGTTAVFDGSNNLIKSSSSRRFKTQIRPLQKDPERILGLQPKTFVFKDTGQPDLGYIAEEVESVAPELVTYDDEGRAESVKYDRLAIYLIEILKQERRHRGRLENEVEDMNSRVEEVRQNN